MRERPNVLFVSLVSQEKNAPNASAMRRFILVLLLLMANIFLLAIIVLQFIVSIARDSDFGS
jgi:heme/copper-type cytochrome/quinol oxidase subunit 2